MRESEEEDDISVEPEEESGTRIKSKSEKTLREELKACHKEKEEYLAGWQRAKADLINFKREVENAREGFAKFATEDLIYDLLAVLDSFERAVLHSSDRGVEQVYKQLLAALKGRGLEGVAPVGEMFDPKLHESVGSVEVNDKSEVGKVIKVTQTGFMLHDKLLRAPKVRVGEYKN